MQRLILTVALCCLCVTAIAQDNLPEYGDRAELKDKHKIYVTTAGQAFESSRALILAELRRYPGVEVVNSPDEAEVFMIYSVVASTEERGRQRSHYLRSTLTAYTMTATNRHRILWSEDETYAESGGLSFSRPNEVNLARHFVKALKQLRGEKK